MYDGFSDTGKHSAEWVQITKEFLKLAFVGGRREASCPCSRCENRRMLSNGFGSPRDLWRTTFRGTSKGRCSLR
jgi:hypothetical protein